MARIGIITIGQSPRVDVVPELAPLMGLEETDILEMGALDGLSPQEVEAYKPGPDDFHLATRMQDGSEVIVAKEKILPRMARAVKKMSGRGVSLILLLCNGTFPRFETDCLIIEPNKLVNQVLAGLIDPSHRLGVMLPVAEQCDWARESFASITPQITTAVASPYSDQAELDKACAKLESAGCDLVVLYCMGFNPRLGAKVRNRVSMPVLVSSTLTARVIGELAGGA